MVGLKNGYGDLPPQLQQVHWRIDKVEECIEKVEQERKDTDKTIFEKFDKLNTMIIYQLCAIIITLIGVLAIYLKG